MSFATAFTNDGTNPVFIISTGTFPTPKSAVNPLLIMKQSDYTQNARCFVNSSGAMPPYRSLIFQ